MSSVSDLYKAGDACSLVAIRSPTSLTDRLKMFILTTQMRVSCRQLSMPRQSSTAQAHPPLFSSSDVLSSFQFDRAGSLALIAPLDQFWVDSLLVDDGHTGALDQEVSRGR